MVHDPSIMNSTTEPYFVTSVDISLYNFNGSNKSHQDLLIKMNNERAIDLIPAMLYIGILMVVGVLGNSFVCCLFSRKLKPNTQNFLFIWLAIFDLISCCVAMPTEIYDIRHFYTFDNEIACKCLRFFVTFPTIGSNVTLLIIAVDRFRKVCRPLHPQITRSIAKRCIVIAIATGILFAVPTLFIYGKRTAATRIPGLVGVDCSVSDSIQNRLYPLIYELCLVAAFIAFTIALSVIYFRIWKTIKKHNKYMKEHATFELNLLPRENDDSWDFRSPDTPNTRSRTSSFTQDVRDKTTSGSSARSRNRANRTTVVASLVTIVFVLSFLPHLSLIIVRTVKKDFDHHLEGGTLCIYNIFLRSYFVNSVSNPIIYTFMNIGFRRECTRTVIRWFRCRSNT